MIASSNCFRFAGIMNRRQAQDSENSMVKKYLYMLFVPGEESIVPKPHFPTENEDDLPCPKPILKNLEDLRKILSKKPFDLEWFQNRMEKLVLLWNKACFGQKQPVSCWLMNDPREAVANTHRGSIKGSHLLPFARQPKTAMLHPLSCLGKKTHGLHERQEIDSGEIMDCRDTPSKDHGADTLVMSRKLAGNARKIPCTTLATRTKKKQRMESLEEVQFGVTTDFGDGNDDNEDIGARIRKARKGRRALNDERRKSVFTIDDTDADDDNCDDDEDDDDYQCKKVGRTRTRSSKVRKRMDLSGSLKTYAKPKYYTVPPPDPGYFDDKGNVIHKHLWSENETNALVAGVRKFGIGKWQTIKNEYGDILRNRNNVQLKDKWRVLERKGMLAYNDG
jgi:hypothetical protein